MVNKQLKSLEKEELYALLVELTGLSKKNADFLDLKMQKNPDAALEYYKKKVKEIFWSEKINLREARKALSDFKKISKEPEHLLELMVFYVENGIKVDNEYGDMYEVFYSSIESMFGQVIRLLNEHPQLIPAFKQRLDWIIEHSCEGWGHKDTLEDIYVGLGIKSEEL